MSLSYHARNISHKALISMQGKGHCPPIFVAPAPNGGERVKKALTPRPPQAVNPPASNCLDIWAHRTPLSRRAAGCRGTSRRLPRFINSLAALPFDSSVTKRKEEEEEARWEGLEGKREVGRG